MSSSSSSSSDVETIVYGHPVSQPVRTVLLFLEILKVPYKFELIVPGSRKSPKGSISKEFLQLNPFGNVPVFLERTRKLVQSEFCLSESHAILVYLARKYQAKNWYPYHDMKQAAKIDRILHWHHSSLRMISTWFFGPKIRPDLKDLCPPYAHRAMKKRILPSLENLLSKSKSGFLVTFSDSGQESEILKPDSDSSDKTKYQPSIADLSAWMEVMQIQTCDIMSLDDFPNIKKWLKKVEDFVPEIKKVMTLKGVSEAFQKVREAKSPESSSKL